MENTEAKFDTKDIQSVTLNLLNWQVDIILRSLELYGYNLEYMLDSIDGSNTNKDEKIAMLKYTYEQVLATQAEQVNGKANNEDNVPAFGKLILQNNNKEKVLKII